MNRHVNLKTLEKQNKQPVQVKRRMNKHNGRSQDSN